MLVIVFPKTRVVLVEKVIWGFLLKSNRWIVPCVSVFDRLCKLLLRVKILHLLRQSVHAELFSALTFVQLGFLLHNLGWIESFCVDVVFFLELLEVLFKLLVDNLLKELLLFAFQNLLLSLVLGGLWTDRTLCFHARRIMVWIVGRMLIFLVLVAWSKGLLVLIDFYIGVFKDGFNLLAELVHLLLHLRVFIRTHSRNLSWYYTILASCISLQRHQVVKLWSLPFETHSLLRFSQEGCWKHSWVIQLFCSISVQSPRSLDGTRNGLC